LNEDKELGLKFVYEFLSNWKFLFESIIKLFSIMKNHLKFMENKEVYLQFSFYERMLKENEFKRLRIVLKN
jgi:hypothetical protein